MTDLDHAAGFTKDRSREMDFDVLVAVAREAYTESCGWFDWDPTQADGWDAIAGAIAAAIDDAEIIPLQQELAAERARCGRYRAYMAMLEADLSNEFTPSAFAPSIEQLIDDRRFLSNFEPGDLPAPDDEGEVTT